MGTFKFFLYHLTDLMMFGETEDLINYWDKENYDIGLKKMGLDEKNYFISLYIGYLFNKCPNNPK